MLLAFDLSQNRLVVARRARKEGVYVCPSCQQNVTLRQGNLRKAHFAHQQVCSWETEGESWQHLWGKQSLARQLSFQGWQVILEEPFRAIGQRPDLVLRRGLNQLAIEYQCAALSTAEVQRRQAGYQSIGMPAFWILGPRYQHLSGQQLCRFISHGQAGFVTYHLTPLAKKLVVHHHSVVAFEPLRLRRQASLLGELRLIQRQLSQQQVRIAELQRWLYQRGYHALFLPWMCHLPCKTLGMRKPAWYLAAKLFVELTAGPCKTDQLIDRVDIKADWEPFGLLERRLWISGPWVKYVLSLWSKLGLIKRVDGERWSLIDNQPSYCDLRKKQMDLSQFYVQWQQQVVEY